MATVAIAWFLSKPFITVIKAHPQAKVRLSFPVEGHAPDVEH